MIGKLKGIIDELGDDFVLIDVSGVVYHVFCSSNTLRALPAKGEAITLLIETHVREDHIHLFGFANANEKKVFHQLLKVNGVGTRMAIGILSVLTPEALYNAIAAADKQAFKTVSGVGPKLATRLITELKDKVILCSSDVLSPGQVSNAPITNNTNISDAIMALTGLGFSRSDAFSVVQRIAAQNDNLLVDDLIRQGLKELSSA